MIFVLEILLPCLLGLFVIGARARIGGGGAVPPLLLPATAGAMILAVTVAWLLGPERTAGRWAELQLLWLAPALLWTGIGAWIGGRHGTRTAVARTVRNGALFLCLFLLAVGLSWLASLSPVQWLLLSPRAIAWPVDAMVPVGEWVERVLPALTTFHGRMDGWVGNRLVLCSIGAVLLWRARKRTAVGGDRPVPAGKPAVALSALVLLVAGVAWLAPSQCRSWRYGVCEGRLDVPVNARSSSAATLRISYLLRPAARAAQPQGVVVAAVGGPASASAARAGLVAALGEVGDTHDILISDYRGFGRSSPVACPGVEVGPARSDAVADCLARLGPLANELNAQRAADDLEAVRKHLGFGRLDLYGQSYGTFFAQVYAQRYPGSVRSLILDSALPAPLPPEFDFMTGQLSGEDPLQHFCALQDECDDNPRLVSAWREVIADAREGRTIAPDIIDLATLHLFSLWPEIDRGRREALLLSGEARRAALAELAGNLRRQVAGMRGSSLAGLFTVPSPVVAYGCNDYWMPFARFDPVADRIRATRSYARAAFGRNIGPFTWEEMNTALEQANGLSVDGFRYEACLYWTYSEPPPAVPDFPATDVLVISGALDSTTTPAMADLIAGRWPRARVLRVSEGDHFVLGDPRNVCARTAARDFLLDPAGYAPTGCGR